METEQPDERPTPDIDRVRRELGERDRKIDESEQDEDEGHDEDEDDGQDAVDG